MKPLGTILPTAKSLAQSDAHFEKMQRLNFAYANNHPVLGISPRVFEKGEHRWIIAPTIYAVVGNQTAKFFERRHDGDYSIKYSTK
jgi:hypothetical protein